jgi:serine/threonine protein kinase/Tol biopolymer transport system component
MTDPEQSAAELFGEVLDLPPERRAAFLDQACRDAPELRRLVEQLLLEDQRAGSFLLSSPYAAGSNSTPATATLRDESARFRPAQLIANRFLVVRFIARGGMGEVYEARDQFLQGASVALKIIRPEIASDSATSSRFEQEVILARKVVHSNLCPIYEIFRCDEPAPPFLFLTMRLLEGETLYARLEQSKEQSKKLDTGQAVDICKQLLAGVAALHAGGVIHRDLKPNNVMLEASGSGLHVSVMDFGLARPHEAANTLFGSGVIAGTPGYMAPELLRGGRPTKATDLFALGVVLHQVLTGERPLAPEHGLSLAPLPSLRSAGVPADWVQAVEGFLSPDPESRTRAFERLWPAQNGAATLPRPSLWKEKGIWYAAVASAVLLVTALVALKTQSPVSAPLESTQITSTAEPKEGPLFTDGSRLYFESHGIPSEMAVGGGPMVPMRILERGMLLLDISADASKALGFKVDGEDTMARGTLWTTAMLGGTPRKVSDHLANGARWSPDGRSVVFFDRRTIYRIGADGENLTRIWEAPTDVNDLAFSPDGRQLSVTVDSSPGTERLWRLSADGQHAQPLQFDWPADVDQSAGQWTPDGRHFLFSSDREGLTNVYELVPPHWFEFWKKPAPVRITGNQISVLASAPSRDSRGLFVLGGMDQGVMRAYDPQLKKLAPLLEDVSMLGFVISPDREWMAYTEYPSRHLWKSRLDGSEKLQLTNSYAVMEQWSPDGKWLVYSDWKHLFLVSSDGGPAQVLPPDGRTPIAPTWSSDGKTIAFSYFPLPEAVLNLEIIDLASRRISLMPGSEGYYYPSWSPDGKYLVAMAENPARMVLYSKATGTWKDLHAFPEQSGFWAWSPDSNSLYMALFQTKESDGIYRMTIPRGGWEKLSGVEGINPASSVESFVSLTREGQPAVMSRIGAAQIYLLRWPQ